MQLPGWLACCQRLTQLCVGKRSRNLWIMAATIVTLTLFYNNTSVTPTEPHVKRSHSPASGEDSVSVVYAPTDDHDVIDSSDYEHSPKDGQAAAIVKEHPQPAVSHQLVFHSDKVRLRDTPFDAEQDFAVLDWDQQFGAQPLPLPPFLSGNDVNASVPEAILKIIADLQGEEDTKSKPSPLKPPGEHKKPKEPPASSNSSGRPVPRTAGGQNASHLQAPAQKTAPRSPDTVEKQSRQGARSGDGNGSLAVAEDERGGKGAESQLPHRQEPHRDSSVEMPDMAMKPSHRVKGKKAVEPDLAIPGTDTDTMPHHGGKAKKAGDVLSLVEHEETATKPAHGGKGKKALVAPSGKQHHPSGLRLDTPISSLLLEYYQLIDPDDSEERWPDEDDDEDETWHWPPLQRLEQRNNPDLGDDFDLSTVDPLATPPSHSKRSFADLQGAGRRDPATDQHGHTPLLDPAPHHHSNASQAKGGNPRAPEWTSLVGGVRKPSDSELAVVAREAELVQAARETFNFTLWKGVHKERKRLLRSKCEEHANHKSKRSVFDSHSIVDRKHGLLYCPVEKSASTFFRRFMFSLANNSSKGELLSPFKVPIDTALGYKFDTLRSLFRKGQEHEIDDSVKLLVVREPFSRLFSAYVDKLLVPNSLYWKEWGVPIISMYRHAPSKHSLVCGNDVTFPEFVKFVLEELHGEDEHVQPVSAMCSPCDIKFSVIAHKETLRSDIQYLTSLLKVTIANYSADSLMDDVTADAIRDSTFSAFAFFKELKPCVTKLEMVRRLWRKMQLRGVVSEELGYPLSHDDTVKVSAADLVRLLLDARDKSRNSVKLRQQKDQALKDAFEKVPAEDIVKLVKIYSLDFELFGYSKYPAFLDIDF